jgi:putative phosphoesterase
MLIGIMSDSHGRAHAVRAAVALFDQMGVAHIIHCGDVGGIEVFDELAGRDLTFVWGNTDFPAGGLLAYLHSVRIAVPDAAPVRLTLDGRSFAVFHGHEPGFEFAHDQLDVDYILHGHTHEQRDDRAASTRIINPGALHRAKRKTVATLDTADDVLTFHDIA